MTADPTTLPADDEPTGLFELAAPRSYRHITRALMDRPWALQLEMLGFMADMLDFRVAGGRLSAEEIAERLAASDDQKRDGPAVAVSGNVAVIPMYGLITQRASLMSEACATGTSVNGLRALLREALNEDEVKAIVFDIDSPGGSVDGIPEFAAELRQAREQKPIIGQVDSLAASAAYWLASSMSEIAITPSGETGSIGVYAAHQDVSAAEEMAGHKTTFISAGKYKVEGNSYEPLGDEARGAIQEQVDTFYGYFLTDIAKGRDTTVDAVRDGYGEGRTMLAKKALAAGMVDRIATLEETVHRLQPRSRRARSAPTPLHGTAAAEEPAVPIAAAAAVHRADPAWTAKHRQKGRLTK